MPAPRMCLILSENWTMTSGRDLPRLVRWAREAEDAGFDSVMISEHIVLGPAANANGLMANPREYALPGNQDPATPWPSSLVLLSAIAAVTTRIRLVASAVIAPLRHPLLLARELGSLDLLSGGRLVVQPTVSWLEEEYAALGVPFRQRGDLLDEHLAAWRVLWRDTPASFAGEHYPFQDVYLEPKAFRPDGPKLWLGGAGLHRRMLERIVAYGDGFNPLGRSRAGGNGTAPRRDARGGPGHAQPGTGRRDPGRVRRPGHRGRSWPGPGGDTAAGGGRVHHLLHQALAVHRRPGGGGGTLPGDHPPGGQDAALTAVPFTRCASQRPAGANNRRPAAPRSRSLACAQPASMAGSRARRSGWSSGSVRWMRRSLDSTTARLTR